MEKHYPCTDVQLLRATKKFCGYGREDQEELAGVRSQWAAPFFDNLESRAATAYETHIGKDYLKDQREATRTVKGIVFKANEDLAMFKVQLEVYYSGEALDSLLNALGFKAYYTAAHRGEQVSMLQLLSQFKQNLTPDLKTELTEKGFNVDLVDRIAAAADELKTADDLQEQLKSGQSAPRRIAVAEFNAIYDIVIGVCKIASKHFKNDPVKKNHYSFNRLVKELD